MERIKEIVMPVVDSFGLVLDDIEYITHGRRWILRIYIDKEGGVSLDDCEKVSVKLSDMLDAENIVPHAYLLEVSSPGLDRPLKRLQDYIRYTGRLIKLSARIPYNNRTTFAGHIISVKGDIITIDTENGGSIEIPFSDIAKARLEVEF